MTPDSMTVRLKLRRIRVVDVVSDDTERLEVSVKDLRSVVNAHGAASRRRMCTMSGGSRSQTSRCSAPSSSGVSNCGKWLCASTR